MAEQLLLQLITDSGEVEVEEDAVLPEYPGMVIPSDPTMVEISGLRALSISVQQSFPYFRLCFFLAMLVLEDAGRRVDIA